jgi:hypothetical protein
LCRIARARTEPASLAPEKQPRESRFSMKKASTRKKTDSLRREYNLAHLGAGVRGKYYQQAIAGTNLVLLDPELARVFKDSASVNQALRLLVNAAESAAHRAGNSRLSTRKRLHPAK